MHTIVRHRLLSSFIVRERLCIVRLSVYRVFRVYELYVADTMSVFCTINAHIAAFFTLCYTRTILTYRQS